MTRNWTSTVADCSKLIGVVGWKNSGKTHLVVDLVRELCKRGLSVSTVKHAHHGFDIDRPGKDSYQHREAGAGEVMIASSKRWALMAENNAEERPPLADLVTRMSPADVILAEGFKTEPHPKIEVWRDTEAPLIAREDSSVIAVVAPDPAALAHCPCPVIQRDDVGAVADAVLKAID